MTSKFTVSPPSNPAAQTWHYSKVVLAILTALLLSACDSGPSSGEKKKAAMAYLESDENFYPEVLEIDDLDLTDTQILDENQRKLFFTVTYVPKQSLDETLTAIDSELSSNPRSIQNRLYSSIAGNPFGRALIRAQLAEQYTDFQKGVPFTKAYWVTLSRTEAGWKYLE